MSDRCAGGAASIRVLEKIGLRREGTLRGLYLISGERKDRVMFGCLASD